MLIKIRSLLPVLLFILYSCFIPNPGSGDTADLSIEKRRPPMQTFIPDCKSIIRRSTHIAEILIAKSKPDAWLEKAESGIKTRNTKLEITIIEVLKGVMDFSNEKPIKITVFQAERMISRYVPIPGVWSEKAVDPGLTYLLFCHYLPEESGDSPSQPGQEKAPQPAAKDVLREENTIMILPVEKNELNVRLMMAAEKDNLSLSGFLDTLKNHTKELNSLFADYAGTRIGEVIFADWEGYKKWISLQENPDLDLKTRVILIEAMLHKLQMADPGLFEFYSLAAINLFRILRLRGTGVIHTNILQTYLPNLLGLRGAGSYKPAAKIFEQNKEDRKLARDWLSSHTDIPQTRQIIEWIEKEE